MMTRKPTRIAALLLAAGAAAILAGACSKQQGKTAGAESTAAPSDTGLPKFTDAGRNAFLGNCAMCHGVWGEGDGPLAGQLEKQAGVRPAGLNDPVRLAQLGRNGVIEVITKGGGRTHRSNLMPPWADKLRPELIGEIADYVMALPVLKPGIPRATVEAYLTSPDGKSDEGRKVFAYYCTACHGPEGHGDGMLADSIWAKGQVRPRNLTDSTYFAPKTDREIFETIALGGRFTGHSNYMPGWGGLHLTTTQIKDVVAYVRTLSHTQSRP
jgi:cbb3-type cytochrome c oxidase subunit III